MEKWIEYDYDGLRVRLPGLQELSKMPIVIQLLTRVAGTGSISYESNFSSDNKILPE